MTDGRTVRLVFDTTAITSWIRGSVAVGELLIEVDNEHGAVLIPFWCLVEAGHATGMLERERLELLLEHPATFLITEDGADWETLVVLRGLVDRIDSAAAIMLALDTGADVLTRHPDWYQAVGGGGLTLLIED